MSDDDEAVARRRYLEEEARADKAEAERDAALARVAYLQQEYDEAHNVIEAGLERENAALAQVEALRGVLASVGREVGSNESEPENVLAGIGRMVRTALSSAPTPAVYTREQAERALEAAQDAADASLIYEATSRASVAGAFWAALDAHPGAEEKT